MNMRISVIGTGYLGATHAACLAELGVDVLGDDERIGRRFLDAGIGFGGGCLPKDIRAFSAPATELGAHSVTELLHRVDTINLRARQRTLDLATDLCGADLRGRRVGVLGAAFKPFSDDVRDSPALDVAGRLHLQGAQVRVYDPHRAAMLVRNARSIDGRNKLDADHCRRARWTYVGVGRGDGIAGAANSEVALSSRAAAGERRQQSAVAPDRLLERA
ncbi:MAG TPA: UDP binding domain-containing protein [Nocardioidaceae bacterium]|nr:UDP binding domain-containing protein [Nocardioidaceae bacterium]